MDQRTIACSLGAEDYQKRLSRIRELGEVALLEVETRPDGAVVSFLDSEQVRNELASIVEAEAACCSFLDLSVRGGEGRLMLAISAPPDAMPIVRDLTASFQAMESIA